MRLIMCALFFTSLATASEAKEVSQKRKIHIYLAGSIQKGHEQKGFHWDESHMKQLRSDLKDFEVVFLDPAEKNENIADQDAMFARDMHYVSSSDFIFVDARDRRGLGVGAEMMWAKTKKIPVITWAPKNTHYNKSQTTVLGVTVNDFIHPFVNALSDRIVENLTEGATWIASVVNNPASVQIKGTENINMAIETYKKKN